MSTTDTVEEVRKRVLSLARQIEDLSQSRVPPNEFFPEFLQMLVAALGARAGAVWMLGGNQRLSLLCDVRFEETGVSGNPQSYQRNEKLLAETMSTGEACSYSSDEDSDVEMPSEHLIILAVLQIDGKGAGVVEIFQRPDAPKEARPGYLQFVEQMCGYGSVYLDRQQVADETDSSSKFFEDFEQFILQLQRSLHVTEVAATAASDGRLLLGCDRLSIAVQRGRKTVIRAISGQDAVNPRANLVRSMSRLASKVIAMRETITYSGKVDHLPPQIEKPLAEFVQESGSRMVMIVPLFESPPLIGPDDKGKKRSAAERPSKTIGCMVVENVTQDKPTQRLTDRAELMADHVAAPLHNARRHQRVFLLPLWRTIGRCLEWFHGRKLAKTLAAVSLIAGLCAALAVVPWDYRVNAKGRLMPIVQREVFAPWDADVVKIDVEGGDRVEQGQPLLELRDLQLTAKLAQAESELKVKLQLVDSLVGQIGKAEEANDDDEVSRLEGRKQETKWEIQGLEVQVKILEDRKNMLTVRAPISGFVVTFQIEQRLLGRPVRMGEVLLEVMDDTDEWRLELEAEEKRMGHVLRAQQELENPQLRINFILETKPESTYRGKLQTIATRIQNSPEEGSIVEIFASIDEGQELPDHRVGADVRAKIYCGQRSLGYVLFGDVVEFIQKRWLF